MCACTDATHPTTPRLPMPMTHTPRPGMPCATGSRRCGTHVGTQQGAAVQAAATSPKVAGPCQYLPMKSLCWAAAEAMQAQAHDYALHASAFLQHAAGSRPAASFHDSSAACWQLLAVSCWPRALTPRQGGAGGRCCRGCRRHCWPPPPSACTAAAAPTSAAAAAAAPAAG